jgi:hypothetical protein
VDFWTGQLSHTLVIHILAVALSANHSYLSELVNFWTGQLSHTLVIHILAVTLSGESFISERASGLLDRSAFLHFCNPLLSSDTLW